MQLFKPLSLLGLVATFNLSADAQNVSRTQATRSQSVARRAPASFATVDAFGNVIKTTVRPSHYNSFGGQGGYRPQVYGPQQVPPQVVYGNTPNVYYPPAYPAYSPYPPVNTGVTNNYYLPEPAYTIDFPSIDGGIPPVSISSIPLGTYTTGPAYPAYGYPGYGYPAAPCPVPYKAYPGYAYPGYGYPAPAFGTTTTTTIIGATGGRITTQSQNNGFGVSIGRGGLSVNLGNRNSTTTTTVTPF